MVIVSHDQRPTEIADPAWGMAVEIGDLPHLEHDGRTWWFCSTHCRDEFEAQSQRFLEAPSA